MFHGWRQKKKPSVLNSSLTYHKEFSILFPGCEILLQQESSTGISFDLIVYCNVRKGGKPKTDQFRALKIDFKMVLKRELIN